jgi:5-methylthioadenosine/S-adenosylhomocysteine deaminase
VPAFELLLAKGQRKHIKGLIVAGRDVVRDGAVTSVDLPALEAELLAALRAAYPTTADVRAAIPEFKSALRKHYSGPLYCA